MMDIVIEIMLELYVAMMLLIVPEKNVSKKHIWIAKIAAIFMLLGIFALVIWGGVLIAEYHNLWGIVPIAIAVVLSLLQSVAGIILYKKHH